MESDAESLGQNLEIGIRQFRSDHTPAESHLLIAHDIAIGVVVEEQHYQPDPLLGGGGEVLRRKHEPTIASDRPPCWDWRP